MSTHYQIVIYGGNPAGIACAVRAAREGLTVLLVNHTPHLGGLPANGMGLWDTLYEGYRAPIYNELRQAVFDYYRETYGEDSAQYAACLPGETGHSNGKYEACVFEQLVDDMVARESNITVVKSHYPVDVKRNGQRIDAMIFCEMGGVATFEVTGDIFVDCSYEGDVLPLAQVDFRVGRESRAEYNEPHAGRIFMQFTKVLPESEQYMANIAAGLNLRQFGGAMETLYPESTGEGDGVVQAMNFRTALSSDPDNQVKPSAPEGYDPNVIKHQLEILEVNKPDRGKNGGEFPNNKSDWNRPQLIEGATDYVHGDWPTRQKIMRDFWNLVIGIMYYFQNDPDAPEDMKAEFQKWGLAKDEFADHGHMPWEIYVREARRLVGQFVLTEHDVRLGDGIDRAPIHSDSIAICEWYTDVHACHAERVRDSRDEGKVMLHKQTVPGQIPYRSLLPKDVDNLLVPVCLSSSHLGQSAVRLEPTWMQIAESAAWAAVQAVENKQTLVEIDVNTLQRTVAESRSMISFFNDVPVDGEADWTPAVQWAGTQGFFATYEARPNEVLDVVTAKHWIDGFARFRNGTLDVKQFAQALASLSLGEPVTGAAFLDLLHAEVECDVTGLSISKNITRGEACLVFYQILGR